MEQNPSGESSAEKEILEAFNRADRAAFEAVGNFRDTQDTVQAALAEFKKAQKELDDAPGDKDLKKIRDGKNTKHKKELKKLEEVKKQSREAVKNFMRNVRDKPGVYLNDLQCGQWVTLVLISFLGASAGASAGMSAGKEANLLDGETGAAVGLKSNAVVKMVDIGSALGLVMGVIKDLPKVMPMGDTVQVLRVYSDWAAALGEKVNVTCLIFDSRRFWLGSTLAQPIGDEKPEGKKPGGKEAAAESAAAKAAKKKKTVGYRQEVLKKALKKHGVTLPALSPRLQISLAKFFTTKFVDYKLIPKSDLFKLFRAVVGDTDGHKNPAWNRRESQTDFNQIQERILKIIPGLSVKLTFEAFEQELVKALEKDYEATYGECAETYPLIYFLNETEPSNTSPFAEYEGLAVDTGFRGLSKKKPPCANCAALLIHLRFELAGYNSQLDSPQVQDEDSQLVIWDWDVASDKVTKDPSRKGPKWDHGGGLEGVP